MLLFQFVAVLAATLFTGAAIYINVAEHPERMGCVTAVAARVVGPSYRQATTMQAVLAVISTVIAIGAPTSPALSWRGSSGAVFIFAVVRFTLLVIMPTNK